MKRSFLDITKRLFRQPKRIPLELVTLEDDTYWIYKTYAHTMPSVLREISGVDLKKNTSIAINTQKVRNVDYTIEHNDEGMIVKINKSSLTYELSTIDFVELFGQFE